MTNTLQTDDGIAVAYTTLVLRRAIKRRENKIAFQSKTDHRRVYSELYLVTLILKCDLDNTEMHLGRVIKSACATSALKYAHADLTVKCSLLAYVSA